MFDIDDSSSPLDRIDKINMFLPVVRFSSLNASFATDYALTGNEKRGHRI